MVEQSKIDTSKLTKIIEETEGQIALINQIPETVKTFQSVTDAFSDALEAQKTYKSHLELIITAVNDQRKQSEKQYTEFSNEIYSLVQKIRGENNQNIQLIERHQQQVQEKLMEISSAQHRKQQEQINQFEESVTKSLDTGIHDIKRQTDNIIYLIQENHKAMLDQMALIQKLSKKRFGGLVFWILFSMIALAGYMVYMDFFFH